MSTIKAGTYIFVESPAKPSSTAAVAINFKMYYLTANNTYANVTADGTHIQILTSFGGAIYLYPITESGDKGTPDNIYGGNDNTWTCRGLDDNLYTTTDTTKLRTIIIETDQTVDDETFVTWFTANTTAQTSKLSVDLTTLPGWANLSAGNHTIKIKAKGTGYKESELSAGVTVSKAASTVTLEKGTYKFVETPNLDGVVLEGGDYMSFACKSYSLTANNVYGDLVDYSRIIVDETNVSLYPEENDRPSLLFDIDDNTWKYDIFGAGPYTATDDNKLRTIILETDQQVSQEFYNWAITQGNLVKQAVSSHTLTISDAYTYDSKIDVNGNDVTSPYTLQNGDIINVPTVTESIVINGTSYATGYEGSLNINGEDIAITRTGPERTIDPDIRPATYITIHYTQS